MYKLHTEEVDFIHRFCQETNQSFDVAIGYVQEAKEVGMSRTVNRMIRGVEESDNVKVIVGRYFSESLDRIDYANATINVATSLKDKADEPDMIVVVEVEDDKLDKENNLSIERLFMEARQHFLDEVGVSGRTIEEVEPGLLATYTTLLREIWARRYFLDGYPMTKELRNISYVCEGDYTFYKTATWSNHSGWYGFTYDGDEHLITQEGMLAWDEKIS